MLTYPTRPGHEVMILGAGFSKSLSGNMPLTDALGNRVLKAVATSSSMQRPNQFELGQFETWLSRIGEEQPDLTTSENLSNRALFELCSRKLATVLDECVDAARDEALSRPWLFDFLGTVHARKATIITFNQDTLIELAVEAAHLSSWDPPRSLVGSKQWIGWRDCLDCQPPFPPTRYQDGLPQTTFRLLKLHGSTNWFWRSGDDTGATTACWYLPGAFTSENGVTDEAAALRRELPGRVPLIVPPTAGKSTYYRTPMLTQLWQDARSALTREHVRVSLLGYSIPPTDLVTSGMLRETLSDRTDPVDVVNPDPDPVSDHLKALGVDPSRVNKVDAVVRFAEEYQSRSAIELVEEFRRSPSAETDCSLLAGVDIQNGLKVIGFGPERDGQLDLILEENNSLHSGTNVPPQGSPPSLKLAQLLRRLGESPTVMRLTAVSGGERRPVVAAAGHVTSVGAGNGRWQILITARPFG